MSKAVEFIRDPLGAYRWRVVAEDGRILTESQESYLREADCLEEAERIFGSAVVYRTDGGTP